MISKKMLFMEDNDVYFMNVYVERVHNSIGLNLDKRGFRRLFL